MSGGGGAGGSSAFGLLSSPPRCHRLDRLSLDHDHLYGPSGNGNGTGNAPLNTTIDAHPAKLVETRKAKRAVKFRFSANLLGASFRARWTARLGALQLAQALRRLPGKHTFKVTAVVNLTPASFGFKVKRKFPALARGGPGAHAGWTATTPIAALACLLFALVGATAARAETVSLASLA